jgi:2-desacetyl-2-hydroxyethyl bacteriochlorophyllide A dehydrogenase
MGKTMKAVRLVEPKRLLEMRELPIPQVGPRDVLVQVKAAGICRSDMHYRAGVSQARPLPMTLGHEVSGIVSQAGDDVTNVKVGDRVVLHYQVSCGDCKYCVSGHEQFCKSGLMIGKHMDGGYAEYIRVPARNAFALPAEIPFEQGAIMMCSSATSFHALHKAEIRPGDRVAIFGVGGLGMSAIQLAKVFGAVEVYAVDIDPAKLEMAGRFGAIPINNRQVDAVAELKRLTAGVGVDAALELIGLPVTIRQALDAVAVLGRAVVVGLSNQMIEVDPYNDLINREAKLIGCSDHLAQEIPVLTDLVRRGILDLSHVVTRTVPLDAGAINGALDRLEEFGAGDVRTVITPGS